MKRMLLLQDEAIIWAIILQEITYKNIRDRPVEASLSGKPLHWRPQTDGFLYRAAQKADLFFLFQRIIKKKAKKSSRWKGKRKRRSEEAFHGGTNRLAGNNIQKEWAICDRRFQLDRAFYRTFLYVFSSVQRMLTRFSLFL